MCWTAGVSFTVAAIEIFLLSLMWASKACRPYARALWPLAITVITVEVCEGFAWPYVIDLAHRMANSVQCPLINTVLTQTMLSVVSLQPLFWSSFAQHTPLGAKHPHLKELNLLKGFAVMFFLAWCITCAATFIMDAGDRVYEVDGHGTPLFPKGWSYATTCAYKGPHGHQLWQAATSNKFRDIAPNSLTYFGISAAAIFFMYDKVETIAWMIFFALFAVMFAAWNGGEAGSTWCFSGILIFVFYVVFPNVKERLRINAVTSWSDFLPCQRLSCELDDSKKQADDDVSLASA